MIRRCTPTLRSLCPSASWGSKRKRTQQISFSGLAEGGHSSTICLDFSHLLIDGITRVCPGQKFADANIFLVMANVLATMDVFSPDPADAMRGLSCDDFGLGMTR